MAKSIFVDIARCIYCRACEIACAREHKGISLISVALVDERYAVPLNCRQCEKSPCIPICSPRAIVKSKEGILLVDPTKCNGCRLCIMVCPIGVIQFDYVKKIVRICDLCRNLLEEGREPTCIATCPTKALIYGEFDNITGRFRERAAAGIIKDTGLKLGFLLKD